jgi:hypothetical protein
LGTVIIICGPEETTKFTGHQVHRGAFSYGVPARRVLANYFAGNHRVAGLLGQGPDLEFRYRDGSGRSVLSQSLNVWDAHLGASAYKKDRACMAGTKVPLPAHSSGQEDHWTSRHRHF